MIHNKIDLNQLVTDYVGRFDRVNSKHADTVRQNAPNLPEQITKLREVIEFGAVVSGKPKVHKLNKTGSVKTGNLYVSPDVCLTFKQTSIRAVVGWHLNRFSDVHDPVHGTVVDKNVPTIPYMFRVPNGIPYTGLTIDPTGDEMVSIALFNGLEERWNDIYLQIIQSMQSQLDNADSAITNHRVKRGSKDRKNFQVRMMKTISECPNLREKDEQFLLQVMQLDSRELEILLKFSKKNKADLDIVDADDIRGVLDILVVGDILES